MADKSTTPSTANLNFPSIVREKFDCSDVNLDGLLDKNHKWAKAVTESDPNYFKDMALGQTPNFFGSAALIVVFQPIKCYN
ncbi:unnamed protein product [Absidia cylindrospora]